MTSEKTEGDVPWEAAGADATLAGVARFITQAPVAVAMLDRGMRYLAWSPGWLAVYGLGTRDLRGVWHYDLAKGLPERWRDAHRRGLAGEAIDCEEDCWKGEDGREIWMSWSIRPIADARGQTAAIAIYTVDITERKRAEVKAQDSQDRLRQITDALGIGVFEHDFATGRSHISSGYLNLLNISPDQVPQTTERWVDLLRPADLAAYHEARRRALDPAGDGNFSFEVHPIVDGHERVLEVKSIVRFAGSGTERRPERLIGIIVDQTESRRLQDALSRAQRPETVGRLAGMVAHDFNNLLTVVLSSLELADLRTADADVRNLLHQAADAAEMGAGFTKRLLALAGGHRGAAVPLVLDEHLGRVWEMFKRVLSDAIDLRFQPGAQGVVVAADPAEIDGALLNLVMNARDAQPGGGRIVLTTDVAEIDEAEARRIRGGKTGRFLRLSISDRGTGMAPEVVARAGEPFFSTKGAGRGTGLGLTSVMMTAERAGGFLQIRSAQGQGTEVVIHLPALEQTADPLAQEDPEIQFGDGELVLVVEDDALVREAVMQRLEAIGFAVIEAANGEVALALIEAGEPVDLVFSDVVMPGALSGYDLVRQVQENHPGIGVLLTSGHVSSAYRETSPQGPPVELLTKPYSLKALAGAVGRALRRVQAPA